MNFTREPIIETVITPREGCKLVVRSSKGNNQEDYFVDAVEVVSFGHSFFFRSLERPKSFLVPVSDYEILELKETRMVLKNVTTDRSIKIGGGRENAPRPSREMPPLEPPREEFAAESRAPTASTPSSERPQERPSDRKRDKRRRGRRGRERHESPLPGNALPEEHLPQSAEEEARPEPMPEEVKAPSFISKLFPPPPTLIKETLSRYKPVEPISPAPVQPVEEDLFLSEERATFEESIIEHPENEDSGDERGKETHFDD